MYAERAGKDTLAVSCSAVRQMGASCFAPFFGDLPEGPLRGVWLLAAANCRGLRQGAT